MSDGTQTAKIVNGSNALAVDSLGAVTINNAANQTYTYTTTSSVSAGTVVLGPYTCSSYRALCLHIVASSTGSYAVQVSNNGTNWSSISGFVQSNNGGALNTFGILTATTGYTAGSIISYPLQGAQYVQIIVNGALSGSTNTIIASLSQQPLAPTISAVSSGPNPINVNLTTAPGVTSGFSLYHTLVSAATTNATLVKSSQGQIGSLILTNSSATWAYFKFVNKASAPTVGTDTAVLNIGVAPNSTLDCSTSYAGLRLTTGIAYYVSGGTSLTDNTALLAANTFLVNMTYV